MTLAIDAIQGIQGAGSVHKLAEVAKPSPVPSTPALSNEVLANRFEALVRPPDAAQRPTLASPAAEPEGSGPTAIGRMLDAQEGFLKQTIHDTEVFTRNVHLYSADQIAAAGHMIAQKTAFGAISLNASMAVAQSSNKSVQSLLKNQ
jgi:type III secretion system HrpB2-like protein